MKNTKIIATLGPASDDPVILEKLVQAGANIFRLNFSHGTHEEHGARIDHIQALRKKLEIPLGIILDTKGPEIRLGNFAKAPIIITEGQPFTLTIRDEIGDENHVSLSYKELTKDIKPGAKVLIDDGLVQMEVKSVEGDDIHCVALNDGELSNHKGVNVPGIDVRLPAVTDKDIEDIVFGIQKGVDFIAASFVRKSEDILAIRRLLHENGGDGIQIISKIESRQAVLNIDEIVQVSDAVMVARGDMGVELPLEEVPVIQKELIHMCQALGRPVIIATQMMDSMIRNPRPTRAEVNDVANAVYEQCDCVMLSGESAAGAYPVESVQTMATICKAIEANIQSGLRTKPGDSIADAVALASCDCAENLNAKAIITITSSGYTARMVAKYRPQCPIIAFTENEKTYQRLSLIWGVDPILGKEAASMDETMEIAVEDAKNSGRIKDGDTVILTAGVPRGVSGSTNMLQVHTVGSILARGIPMGHGTVRGRVCLAKDIAGLQQNFHQGDILVVKQTDHDYLSYMRLAGALLCEDSRINCHTAVVGIALGLPVIIGMEGVTDKLKNGSIVTVDAERGVVINAQM